jgi:hypothetical protein
LRQFSLHHAVACMAFMPQKEQSKT